MMESENYVVRLNELAQRARLELKYEDLGFAGPDHNRTFTCRAVLNGKVYPSGVGSNKKEAKKNAAKKAFQSLLEEKQPDPADSRENAAENSSVPVYQKNITQPNYICWLNEYSQKNRVLTKFVESTRPGPSNANLGCRFVVGEKEYPIAYRETRKEAKEEAARLVYLEICGSTTSEVLSVRSDDVTGDELATPPLSQYSFHSESESMPAIFNSKSNPLKIQDPDVKPRRRIAANFESDLKHSKEDIVIPDFKVTHIGNKACKTESVISRFTSEYDSIERLGKGAFGRVFKARNKLLDKYRAIKIVRCKEKALREVRALSDLLHPNIVRYYTCWMEDSDYERNTTHESYSTTQSADSSPTQYLYIEMELCETTTLRLWIDEKNIQNVKKSLKDSKRREESLTIAQQIINGVEWIHQKMLIHRDLKPANILFGPGEEVKIGDFGLVTAEIDDSEENLKERTVYKGTPSYMAPEQKNQSIYDHKVDIFALGLIYFELVWNLSPGPERKVIWDNATAGTLPQGFSLHFPFENNIIKSMLSPKPEDRPEASKVKAQLEDCVRMLMQRNCEFDRKTV